MASATFLIILIWIILEIDLITTCPVECTCVEYGVDCSEGESHVIPKNIPCHTEYFIISDNLVRSVKSDSFSCHTFLQKLVLMNNMISVIEEGAADQLIALVELNLKGNRLTSFPGLSALTKLSIVDISHNLFNEWPMQFPNSQRYKYFGISWNPLKQATSIPLKVGVLRAGGLQMIQISSDLFVHPSHITILYLSYGMLEIVNSLSHLSGVRLINLNKNRIDCLNKDAFQNLTKLERLDLVGNRIYDISAIRDLTSLTHLNLENNDITTITSPALTNLSILDHLILTGNRINDLSFRSYLPNLRVLIVNHNRLQSLMRFATSPVDFQSLEIVNIAETNVSDVVFEEGVSITQFLAEGNSISRISMTSPCNMSLIDLGKNKIVSLQNFRHANNLQTLILRVNYISVWNEAGLRNLSKLRWIEMQHNLIQSLTKLPVLPNLIHLDLSYNRIHWIQNGAMNFPSLVELNFAGNRLGCFPSLTALPALTELFLQENHITNRNESDIGEIPSLRHLNVDDNELQTFPTLPVNVLSVLSIKRNNISVIETGALDNYRSLKKLYLIGNAIHQCPPLALINELYLDNTGIHSMNMSCLKYLPSGLNVLSLKNNRISTLAEHINVINLYVSNNSIMRIKPFTFFLAADMRILDISHNLLSVITETYFARLVALYDLLLQWNELVYLSENSFADCYKLKKLDLSGNKIQAISIRSFLPYNSNLKFLYFSDITSVIQFSDPFTFPLNANAYVHMDNNSMVKNTSFVIIGSVLSVSVQRNDLSLTFPRIECRNLLKLDLSFNSFYKVPEQITSNSPYPFLMRLYLGWNDIKVIESDTFSSLAKLYTLKLNDNAIVAIKHGAFRNCRILRNIDLSNNNLHFLREVDLPPRMIGLVIGLKGNPWHCDCHMTLFINWIILSSKSPTCATPAEFATRNVTDVVVNENCTGERYSGNLCDIEKPDFITNLGERRVVVPCPLGVSKRDDIIWTLSNGYTLQSGTPSPFHAVSILEGNLFITKVTKSLAGNVSCMAAVFGEWIEFHLTLIVTDNENKNWDTIREGRPSSVKVRNSGFRPDAFCVEDSNERQPFIVLFVVVTVPLMSVVIIIFLLWIFM